MSFDMLWSDLANTPTVVWTVWFLHITRLSVLTVPQSMFLYCWAGWRFQIRYYPPSYFITERTLLFLFFSVYRPVFNPGLTLSSGIWIFPFILSSHIWILKVILSSPELCNFFATTPVYRPGFIHPTYEYPNYFIITRT